MLCFPRPILPKVYENLSIIFADHYSGPGRVIDLVCICVCLCVWTVILEKMIFDLDILLPIHLVLIKVRFEGQGHGSEFKVVG